MTTPHKELSLLHRKTGEMNSQSVPSKPPLRLSPHKKLNSLYYLYLEGLSLHEKKELLDFCMKHRCLVIQTKKERFPFDRVLQMPKQDYLKMYHAVLYADNVPQYFISSNNFKDTMEELAISGSNVYVVFHEYRNSGPMRTTT